MFARAARFSSLCALRRQGVYTTNNDILQNAAAQFYSPRNYRRSGSDAGRTHGGFGDDREMDLTDLALLLILYGGPCEGDTMIGGDDPLTQWLRSATPQHILDWWNAGMPPVGGGEQ